MILQILPDLHLHFSYVINFNLTPLCIEILQYVQRCKTHLDVWMLFSVCFSIKQMHSH